MTTKQLEEMGFYKDGLFIKQMLGFDKEVLNLGWFGIRVKKLEELKPIDLIIEIYKLGIEKGKKEGANNLRHSINELLRIDE